MGTLTVSNVDRWQSGVNLIKAFKATALGVCLAFGLAACGGGSNATSTPATSAMPTVPAAPTIGAATNGASAQAVVAFSAPSSDGGSAITGYTVTSIPAGGVDSNAGSSSLLHTINGLTNGVPYTFTVHATNAIGNSVESAASNSVTPAVPTAPTSAAPAPSHSIVASVLTTSAADIPGTNFFPNWGQATVYTAATVGGRETAKYSILNYEGIQLLANTNFSTAANVHLDVWTPDVTSLGFDLISTGPVQFQVNSTLTPGVWNSIDIPLSAFTGVDLKNVIQLSFTGVAPASGGTIFVQNIYFWGAGAVASTVPGAPTIGTATGGNAQATVQFTAPASNGGSAITGYTVTSIPAGGVDSNAGTTGLTHIITGLANGTSYTFTVVATNAVGSSVASGASNAVTPAVSVGLVTSTASLWALGGTADFNGATSSLVTNQPAGGLQVNAAKMLVAPTSQYFGTTFLTLVNQEFCTTARPTITMEIYAPASGKKIDLKLEQDGSPALNIEMNKTSVAGWNTYTFNCITDSGSATTPPTNPYVEATVFNKMSLLVDFLAVSPGETWYWDQLTYTPTAAVTYVPPPPFTAPTVAAAAPAHPIVASVLTTSAADIPGTNFFPGWGQTTQYAAITIGGVETLRYSALNYEGINLGSTNGTPTNFSAATHVHFDVWSNVTSLGFDLINSGAVTGGAPVQFEVNSTLTAGWNSVDIPLSSFTGVNLTKVDQLSFTGVTPATGGTIYIQNLYFW